MIVLGADTHKRSHTVAAEAAATGELLGEQTVSGSLIYLQGIDSTEIIDTVHARRPPIVPVDTTLRI